MTFSDWKKYPASAMQKICISEEVAGLYFLSQEEADWELSKLRANFLASISDIRAQQRRLTIGKVLKHVRAKYDAYDSIVRLRRALSLASMACFNYWECDVCVEDGHQLDNEGTLQLAANDSEVTESTLWLAATLQERTIMQALDESLDPRQNEEKSGEGDNASPVPNELASWLKLEQILNEADCASDTEKACELDAIERVALIEDDGALALAWENGCEPAVAPVTQEQSVLGKSNAKDGLPAADGCIGMAIKSEVSLSNAAQRRTLNAKRKQRRCKKKRMDIFDYLLSGRSSTGTATSCSAHLAPQDTCTAVQDQVTAELAASAKRIAAAKKARLERHSVARTAAKMKVRCHSLPFRLAITNERGVTEGGRGGGQLNEDRKRKKELKKRRHKNGVLATTIQKSGTLVTGSTASPTAAVPEVRTEAFEREGGQPRA